MPLKFVTVNDNVFQLLGDIRHPDPLVCAVLKFPLKIPWYYPSWLIFFDFLLL